MQRKVEGGLQNALALYYHQATEGLGPDVEGEQNKAWGEKQLAKAKTTMAWMDEQLADRPYMAGDHFTIADITGMAAFPFADQIDQGPSKDLKNLWAWRERVAARPSQQAVG